MKAPFSKRAKEIFKSKAAMLEINKRRLNGQSLNGLEVTLCNGQKLVLRTSERNFINEHSSK